MPKHVTSHMDDPAIPTTGGGSDTVAYLYGRWAWSNQYLAEWRAMPGNGPMCFAWPQVVVSGPYDPGYGDGVPRSAVENFDVDDDLTIAMTEPPAEQDAVAYEYIAVLRQDATGGHAITFTGVSAPGGTAPTFTTTPDAVDVVKLQWTGHTVGWVVLWHLADVQAL